MSDLVVIVPSRGRPQAALELFEAFGETRSTAHLTLAIDEDDPTRDEYFRLLKYPSVTVDTGGVPATMVRALNACSSRVIADHSPFAIGFMGDDHRPRTKGWDVAYLEALRDVGTGIVYGNDLLQGENLPTQCAMTADIVRALGYMAPPVLKHLYVDNFWRDLGQAAECLRYLPDVVVEHMHPIAGKGDWDEGYARVNAPTMYSGDANAYAKWSAMNLPAAVQKVKALRSVTA